MNTKRRLTIWKGIPIQVNDIISYFSNVLGYKLLAGFIEGAEHCQKFIRKLDHDVFVAPSGLDPIDDCTLDWIFGRLMRIGGVDGESIEYVIIDICSTILT